MIVVLLTFARLPESRDPEGKRVDWLGTVTFTASLFALVLALIRGNDEGWTSGADPGPVRRRGRPDGRLPGLPGGPERGMLDVRLFRKPTFAGAR